MTGRAGARTIAPAAAIDRRGDRPRERRGSQARQPVPVDRPARRRADRRSRAGPVRARHAHPVDVDAAAVRRGAHPAPRALPARRRGHHPADQPGAAPQPGRQAGRGLEPRPPRAERHPDPAARRRAPRAGHGRQLLGRRGGPRARPRARRRHGRHLRGARLSAPRPGHAAPGRDRRQPGRVRLRGSRRHRAHHDGRLRRRDARTGCGSRSLAGGERAGLLAGAAGIQ